MIVTDKEKIRGMYYFINSSGKLEYILSVLIRLL